MIGNPELSITMVLSWLREIMIIASIGVLGWKSRGAWQSVIDFKDRVVQHMTAMEGFAETVVENHLKHIEKDLAKLSGRGQTED